jgi:hypothetical protein
VADLGKAVVLVSAISLVGVAVSKQRRNYLPNSQILTSIFGKMRGTMTMGRMSLWLGWEPLIKELYHEWKWFS